MSERWMQRWRAVRFVVWMLLAIGLAPTYGMAADQEPGTRPDFATKMLTSDWKIALGGNLTSFNTSAAWAPRGLAGAAILLEDTLGLDEETSTAILSASYRFNRRHSLRFVVTQLDRTATRSIDGEIEWGDYIYRADGIVSTDLKTRIFKLFWRYDFSEADRLNAGFLAGLSTFDLGLTLSGEARLESDAGDEWVEGVVEGASAVAPVPVVGFFLDYALSPRWFLHFGTDVIDLSIGSREGRVLEAEFSVEYAVTDWFGLGAGLGGTDLEYRSLEDDEKFAVRYRFSSVGAFASFAF